MFVPSAVVLFEAPPVESTHQKRVVSEDNFTETAYAVVEFAQTAAVPPLAVTAPAIALTIVASENTPVEQLVPAVP